MSGQQGFPPQNYTNPFHGMTSGDQSIGARYSYLEEGEYKLEIHRCKTQGRQKLFYIVEVDILESNVPSRPPGMRCVCFIDLSNIDMRGKNVAGFLAAIFGVDPTSLPKDSTHAPWTDPQAGRQVAWGEYAEWSIGEQNPLATAKVGCRVANTVTREGNDFTAHNWVPYASMVIPVRVQQPQPQQVAQPQWGPPQQPQPQQVAQPQWGPPQQVAQPQQPQQVAQQAPQQWAPQPPQQAPQTQLGPPAWGPPRR